MAAHALTKESVHTAGLACEQVADTDPAALVDLEVEQLGPVSQDVPLVFLLIPLFFGLFFWH